jgi:integrase/recombinase XerD
MKRCTDVISVRPAAPLLQAEPLRCSVTAGFNRTCVIDGTLDQSPAEHVRRPAVPSESPTLGFTHLQFEALPTAARQSANRHDFALVAMLGLLGP